jgi:tetratricopeptide (TPR) repeat protein
MRSLQPALLLLLLWVARSAAAADPAAGRHQLWEASHEEAVAAVARGDAMAARELLLAAVKEAVHFPESDPRTARTLDTFSAVQRSLFIAGGPDAVRRLLEEVDALAAAAGPQALLFRLDARTRMAGLALQIGQFAAAEKMATATLATVERRFGPEHPFAGNLRALRLEAISAQDPRRGVTVAQRYVDAARLGGGVGSPRYADALASLARAHHRAAWPERAIPHAQEAIAIHERIGGTVAMTTRHALAEYQLAAGRAADARHTFEELRRWAGRPDELVEIDTYVASAALFSGDVPGTIAAIARGREAARALTPDSTLHFTLRSLDASVLEAQGEQEAAAAAFERMLAELTAQGRVNERVTGSARYELAKVESRRGNVARVEALLNPGARDPANDPVTRARALEVLAGAYARHGRALEAIPTANRAVRLLSLRYGEDNPTLAASLDALARAHLELGQLAEARKAYDRVLAFRAQRADSVAVERETWQSVARLAERLGDDAERGRAEAEMERRAARREIPRRIDAVPPDLALVENEAFNFRFRPPGREWISFDASRMNPAAKLGFVRRNPDTFLMIVSSSVGADARIGPDGLAAMWAAGMDPSLRMVDRESRRVAGMEGVLLSLEGVVQGQPMRFAVWVTTTPGGFAHQLSVWAASTSYERAALDELALSLFEGFAPLDPERTIEAPPGPVARD